MSLAEAQADLAFAQAALDAALAREGESRQAFLDAPQCQEVEAASALDAFSTTVRFARLSLEKRQAALAEAEEAERGAAAVRRQAGIVELRAARPHFLAELRSAVRAVVDARRAFAAAVSGAQEVVAAENERAAELRSFGDSEPFTEINVVRLAIAQLIEREAPAETAPIDQIPAHLLRLAAELSQAPSNEFEVQLVRLRNAFVAVAGPTVADFCSPQPMPFSDDQTASAQNARSAAALLREIEEMP